MADVHKQQTVRESNGLSNPAGASAAMLADSFNRKVESHLGDRVILKPLTRWNEAYKEFPRYVIEYLCARFVDPKDPCRASRRSTGSWKNITSKAVRKNSLRAASGSKGNTLSWGNFPCRMTNAPIITGRMCRLWAIAMYA